MSLDVFNAVEGSLHTSWRPIHYLGSKLRILNDIDKAILEVGAYEGRVCDLFAGSGTVFLDQAMKRSAVAVDIQEYSRVICSALSSRYVMNWEKFFENCEEFLACSQKSGAIWAAKPLIDVEDEAMELASSSRDATLLCQLLEAGSPIVVLNNGSALAVNKYEKALLEYKNRLERIPEQHRKYTTISRHFGGLYFSFRQASTLDAVLASCSSLTPEGRDLAIAALVTTASELSNTVGKQFAQPIMPRNKHGNIKDTLYSLAARDRTKNAWVCYKAAAQSYEAVRGYGEISGYSVRSDYRDFLKNWREDISVVYADPPYTRDHYSRFYHVLETIARGDDPDISESTVRTGVSRAAYRKDRHQSPFCIKSKAGKAFSDLIGGVHYRGVPLIISYSGFSKDNGAHPRVMSLDELESLAKKYYKNVEVKNISTMVHSRLNRKGLSLDKSVAAETLVVCS